MLGRSILVALSSFTLACKSFSGGQPRIDVAARREELMRTHLAMSARIARGEFIAGMSDIMAAQGFYPAALLAVGANARGPSGARTFLERDTLNRNSRASMTVVRLDVSADGNDGYSYGYLDVIRPAGDTTFGSYKSYWRRRADGKWEALIMTRGRRERGPHGVAPVSLQNARGPYKYWPARDSIEAWSSLRATEAAFSDSSKTSMEAAFISFAAPDAGKVSGATYVFGREQVGVEFRAPPPAGFTGIMWSAEYGSVAASNDLGFNAGRVFARPDASGKSSPGSGMFVTVWRRQPNGEWKYVVD